MGEREASEEDEQKWEVIKEVRKKEQKKRNKILWLSTTVNISIVLLW